MYFAPKNATIKIVEFSNYTTWDTQQCFLNRLRLHVKKRRSTFFNVDYIVCALTVVNLVFIFLLTSITHKTEASVYKLNNQCCLSHRVQLTSNHTRAVTQFN